MTLQLAKTLISENKVVVFSTVYCGYCVAVKNLFKSLNVPFKEFQFDNEENGYELREELSKEYNYYTVPMVFINQEFVGGCDDVRKLHAQNKLMAKINQ